MIKTFFFILLSILSSTLTFAASQTSTNTHLEKAVFAGGCFWCEESAFEGKPGVISVVSGYAGGSKTNPTYEEVSSGGTGHAESVEVTFDPSKTSYTNLLTIFWHNVDPTDAGGQFCDRGNQYRSEIFYMNENQKKLAQESKMQVAKQLQKPIVTEIAPLKRFYPAEDYHQDFYKTNPVRYKTYVYGCGRERRLEQVWGAAAGSSK